MRPRYEEAAFSKENMYIRRFHRVCFTKSSSLEQLHTQLFQLELLNLATRRFRISLHIEDMGWGFKIESVCQPACAAYHKKYYVPR